MASSPVQQGQSALFAASVTATVRAPTSYRVMFAPVPVMQARMHGFVPCSGFCRVPQAVGVVVVVVAALVPLSDQVAKIGTILKRGRRSFRWTPRRVVLTSHALEYSHAVRKHKGFVPAAAITLISTFDDSASVRAAATAAAAARCVFVCAVCRFFVLCVHTDRCWTPLHNAIVCGCNTKRDEIDVDCLRRVPTNWHYTLLILLLLLLLLYCWWW
jgi:hypothetical protein